MSPSKQINRIVGETYSLLKNIRVAFIHIDENMMKKLIVAVILPRLEYAAVVLLPNMKKVIKNLGYALWAATKIVPSF